MNWFHFVITNPDSKKFRFVPYETNPGFVSYRGSQILTLKDRFESLITNPVNFQRFAYFYESNKTLRILSTIARNESLKIEIRKSESLRILTFHICESGFANPNLKDLFRGFVS
jgi:hypothetical protein